MGYDSRVDTWKHIHEVRHKLDQVIHDLLKRAQLHDASKLEEPEVSVFDEFSPKLKDSTYGSEEYKGFLASMGVGLKHHYAVNDHHPEHFIGGYLSGRRLEQPPSRQMQGDILLSPNVGIHGMNLVQMLEMLCDWKAATMRHDDGDLKTSIEQNADRFGYGRETRNLLMHTAAYFGWL